MDENYGEMIALKKYIEDGCYSAGKIINKLKTTSTTWYRKINGKSAFTEKEKRQLQEIFKCSNKKMDILIPVTLKEDKEKKEEVQ